MSSENRKKNLPVLSPRGEAEFPTANKRRKCIMLEIITMFAPKSHIMKSMKNASLFTKGKVKKLIKLNY